MATAGFTAVKRAVKKARARITLRMFKVSLGEYRYYQATLIVYKRYGRAEKVFFST